MKLETNEPAQLNSQDEIDRDEGKFCANYYFYTILLKFNASQASKILDSHADETILMAGPSTSKATFWGRGKFES